jgi:uncharacterized protein (TIGR02444 family)
VSGQVCAWDFVVRRYAEPGVEAACLALQDDHGQCVSLLLWRTWTIASGLAPADDRLASAVETARTWETAILLPLRAVRRRLAHAVPGVEEAPRRRLRQGLLDQELAAERTLVEALASLVDPGDPAGASPGETSAPAAVRALQATVDLWGRDAPDDLLAKLAGAC